MFQWVAEKCFTVTSQNTLKFYSGTLSLLSLSLLASTPFFLTLLSPSVPPPPLARLLSLSYGPSPPFFLLHFLP